MELEQLQKELDKVNKEIATLEDSLKESIDTIGLEFIDLYSIIDLLNNLKIKKNKIQYLIATSL